MTSTGGQMGHPALAFAMAIGMLMAASCVELSGVRDLALVQPDAADASPAAMDASDAAPCLDTSKDPHNCGACGHDCLGGACTKSACMPVEIAFVDTGGSAIAVDATNVYWSIDNPPLGGLVSAVPKAGGAVRQITARPSVRSLATDEDALYIAESSKVGALERCPHGDCGVGGVITTRKEGIYELRLHGPHVYLRTSYAIERANKVGTDDPVTLMKFANNRGSTSFAVDETGIYWSESFDGSIVRCPLVGCDTTGTAPNTIVPGAGSTVLALGATELFFGVNGTSGAVFRVQLDGDGGAPLRIASEKRDPASLLVDAERVYWLTTSTSTPDRDIVACKRNGVCEPMALATSFDPPVALAQDAVALYWVTKGGRVQRLAK